MPSPDLTTLTPFQRELLARLTLLYRDDGREIFMRMAQWCDTQKRIKHRRKKSKEEHELWLADMDNDLWSDFCMLGKWAGCRGFKCGVVNMTDKWEDRTLKRVRKLWRRIDKAMKVLQEKGFLDEHYNTVTTHASDYEPMTPQKDYI